MTEPRDLINLYFPVLDHGFVALKDYMGGDEDVVLAARTSYGFGTHKVNDDRGLLRHLFRHRHTGPFEQVILKFHVRLPIFVARQLVRHRMASLNEASLRYSLAPMQFYIPELENFQKQSKSNKQGREAPVSEEVYKRIRVAWESLIRVNSELYQEAILEDVARELARIHLPVSLYTEWYWTIDLHNLMHFLALRSDSHAQWEIQQFSNVKAGIAKVVAPMSIEAWIDYAFCGARLSRMEWNILRQLVSRVRSPTGDDGIAAPGACLRSMTDLREAGLGKREIEEFLTKFSSFDSVTIPNFDLDLSTARTAQYYYEQAAAAVPERLRSIQKL